ncbi:MAG TPA: TonB-dependent receptor, partial [Flavobacteriales bacterium]|nr:TonB-dependent receptor [Flavobacteriales bacterium]
KVFGLLAERNSVGFVKPITVPDTVSRTSAAYAPRQVDRDGYMNLGSEARLRRSWSWLGGDHELSMGLRAYRAANRRQQLGVGTVASDADLTVNGAFGRELDLFTGNAAFHVENLFRLTKRFSVLPGVRLEHITNRVSGSINTSGSGAVNSGERTRTIPLFGLGLQLNATETTVLYGNITEAFRPVLFGDLTPSGTTDIIDPDLRDASGYNADLGYRGRIGDRFSFDAGIFLMQYDDRIGTRVLDGAVQRTNIGASTSRGLELFLEGEVLAPSDDQITRRLIVFASYAYTDARYTRWNDPLIAEDPTKRIADNRVENAPEHVLRMGLEAALGTWSASLQTSAVDGVFTDAANTRDPNPAATVGWLPGYILVDATVGVKLSDAVALKAGVNNALDLVYATRRAGGYPGPGLLPGMGRQMFVTLSVDI